MCSINTEHLCGVQAFQYWTAMTMKMAAVGYAVCLMCVSRVCVRACVCVHLRVCVCVVCVCARAGGHSNAFLIIKTFNLHVANT